MHAPIAQVENGCGACCAVITNYHAVPGNLAALSRFRCQVAHLWFRTLSQRSQRRLLAEAGTGLRPLVTHSSCCACLSGMLVSTQTLRASHQGKNRMQ